MIVLPKPPSINHIYGYTSRGGFARSFITKEGVAWFKASAEILADHYSWLSAPMTENIEFRINLFTARQQDIDNIIKPILDLFGGVCLDCQGKFTSRKPCSCGNKRSVISNDRNVTHLEVYKEKTDKDHERVSILVMQRLP